jgi:GcrA cell cycle regulator
MSLDELAQLWAEDRSVSAISEALNVTKGKVIGAVWRARKAGDPRFQPRPPRPKVTQERDRSLPWAGKTRKLKPIDEAVGNSRPLPPAPESSGPRLLIDLDWHSCRWPKGEATDGRHLFCGRPQAPGRPYCPDCIERAKGGGAPPSRFVLRAGSR